MQASDILDFLTTTLPKFKKMKFTDNMTKYQNTIVVKRMFKKGKTESFTTGKEIQYNRLTATNGSSRSVGLGFTAQVDIPNVAEYGTVPWRRKTFNWAFDISEIVYNSGESMLLNLNKTRRLPAMGDFIVDVEVDMWKAPVASSNVDFYPIPYWIVKSNTAYTTTNEGFNGLAPSGFTTVGGFNPTSDDKWRNYAEQYSAATKDDLIRKMRRGAKHTDFMPLVEDTPTYNTGNDLMYATNIPVITTMEELLEDQNENLGKDLAPMDNSVMFLRAPMNHVKELLKDTTNPVYQINWGEFKVARLTPMWMKEIPVPVNPNQPTVAAVHTISEFNTICTDRRRQAVFATDTTMPS